MPRCSSSNKFASYDEPEASIEGEEMNGSTYSAEVRIMRPCSECGEEMAETNLNPEADVECQNCGEECPGHALDAEGEIIPGEQLKPGELSYKEPEAPEFEIVSSEVEVDESGGGRYKKNVFTATVTAEIKCLCCGESVEPSVSAEDSCPASGFDVLV